MSVKNTFHFFISCGSYKTLQTYRLWETKSCRAKMLVYLYTSSLLSSSLTFTKWWIDPWILRVLQRNLTTIFCYWERFLDQLEEVKYMHCYVDVRENLHTAHCSEELRDNWNVQVMRFKSMMYDCLCLLTFYINWKCKKRSNYSMSS